MGAATALTRTVGFGRVWMIATILGTTYLGNTYQASSSVSNVLFELLAAGALSAVLVPTFVHHLEADDQPEAERLASGLLGIALIALGIVTVIALFFAPLIAEALTTGAPNATVQAQQESLATFFLWFFIPQVMLYGWGTVSTAVLYAQRRFALAAIAPLANTVAVVASLVIFWLLHGSNGDLDLTHAEKLVLAIGGTLGVVGFVGLPAVAVWRSGFRLRPRLIPRDDKLRGLMHLSGWAVLQHAGIGLLLAAAIVLGNRVEGGVVAYQFAFVLFLAPYAIFAHPVQTTIQNELAIDAKRNDQPAFAKSLRWAMDSMSLLLLPVAAAFVAFAEPAMRAITVDTQHGDVSLLAAAIASLGIGLLPYGLFLLLARALYARDDSRTPALVALVTSILGALCMVAISFSTHGTARVLALGFGHSLAYLLGCLALVVVLRRRLGEPLFPTALPLALGLSVVLGGAGWALFEVVGTTGRVVTILLLAAVGAVGGAIYIGVVRLVRGQGLPVVRASAAATQAGSEKPAPRS